MNGQSNINENATIIETNNNAVNGQNKCPKCGSTDISLNSNGNLRCNFCRHEFTPQKLEGMEEDISKLEGTTVGSGAQDITSDENILTLKCTSCGAEVVIDTSTSTTARCHWCRSNLSINNKLPNGAIPDAVLPFYITKEDAKESIEKFVGKRKFYAHPKFRKEFSTENIMGVYLPYMIIDASTHANYKGQGEHQIRSYTRGTDDNERTYYDAELYDVERDFDLTITGLTVESSKDKLDVKSKNKTTNIINSIMPFDTENCVKWDANYLRGYTSEKRDININEIRGVVEQQTADIARFAGNKTLEYYNRGVRWDNEKIEIKGQQWKAAYLPVWLYSYRQQKSDGKGLLHYVAVNARTKETMGSVPIHKPKLFLISFFIEILGVILMALTLNNDNSWPYIFLASGFVYYAVIYARYRNKGARHKHEIETKTNMSNLRTEDNFVRTETGLTNSRIDGVNNINVSGEKFNFLKDIDIKF